MVLVTIEGFKSYKKQVTTKDFSLKVNCGGMIFFHVLCRGVNEPSQPRLKLGLEEKRASSKLVKLARKFV
ncbi:hypothetical protein HanXRQr2_Chr11g0518011 [Helianthus annuus]|uniref:Uncharacterized protein n=1 Tax=Helianthus annuus TaxID=4232 RepID=A0A9K3HTL6_HELAN|nr:hypothetical protein HanXRQr2_Chr11g0518011 [Helianthus annuus]KAJ0877355.1 hypothetical protein HanPSC8_Chr11g0499181 [Helianthus annuus]